MAEASAWLARLQRDDIGEADGLAFDAWLAAAPANADAYRGALAAWQAFDAGADDIAFELAAQDRRARTRVVTSRRWMVGAGGLALAASLALAILPQVLVQTTAYATGRGEHRHLTLADGSVVDLNAESRLTVRFSGGKREARLEDGEAIFDVAHDADRPFTVAAADRIVRVVGTQFDVRNRPGELTVTVARGRVQVRPTTASGSARGFLLTPGQRLEIGQGGVERLRSVDPQETFSWRAGRLVYRNQPLADVVADLNRQFVDQIEIRDPELASIPITGVIVLDDPQSVVARLTLMLPIRTVPSDRGLLLLRK